MSQQINLFNPAFQERRKLFRAATMAQALALLLIGVVGMSWYAGRQVAVLQAQATAGERQVEKKKAQLALVASELAPRQKSAGLETQLAEAQAQFTALKRIEGVIDRGELGNADGYSEYFRALARQHVDGLWLTGLTVTGAGCEIGVHGRALDAALLPGFLGQLTKEKIMQGKSFGSLQISQPTRSAPGSDARAKAGAVVGPYVEFSLQSKPEGAKS